MNDVLENKKDSKDKKDNQKYGGINTEKIEPKRALYVGRFQTFHKGHESVVKYISNQKDVDEIIIGIGSSQYSRFNQSIEEPLIVNPFTYEERKEYIDSSLKTFMKKPYSFYAILDLHDINKWVKNIIYVLPKISYVYTNSKRESDLFSKLGFECRTFPIKEKIRATIVREMIARDGPWEDYVSCEVANTMKNKGLDLVVKDLFIKNKHEVDYVRKNRKCDVSYDEVISERGVAYGI